MMLFSTVRTTGPHKRGKFGRFFLGGIAWLLSTSPAYAWDPSTTHQGILDAALQSSPMHRRWMDASNQERGIFSSFRVDPAKLTQHQFRDLSHVQQHAHADSGALALGGPGSCPTNSDAPPETKQFCIEGQEWELSAVGWIRVGILVESLPASRISSHFLDAEQPSSLLWSLERSLDDSTPSLAPSLFAWRQNQRNGASSASLFTAAGSSTRSSKQMPSAIAWMQRAEDDPYPWSPDQLDHHLQQSIVAAQAKDRDHHFALAMVCLGAYLHVLQDLTVPAHARGDLQAFFQELSQRPGDRGLPIQEFVRLTYGRNEIPRLASDPSRTDEADEVLASTLLGHILGSEPTQDKSDASSNWAGIHSSIAQRYLSEGDFPSPMFLSEQLSGQQAAKRLLAEVEHLDESLRSSLQLSPWPSDQGRLEARDPQGETRVLGAYKKNSQNQIVLHHNSATYSAQANELIPLAIRLTRSVLNLLWSDPLPIKMRASGKIAEIQMPAELNSAELNFLIEDENGGRQLIHRVKLISGERNRFSIEAAYLAAPSAARRIVILQGTRKNGSRVLQEMTLPSASAPIPAPQ